MVAVDRRLEQVEAELSGRDRARLSVQAVARGEELDDRLDRYCPASERPTMVAIKNAVADGIQQTWQRLLFEIEWLNNDDISMGWLECIAGFLEREKTLRKLAGAQAKSLPAMPKPRRGFIRDIPLLWGALVDPPESPPASWQEAVPFLIAELRKGVEIRWRLLVAYEEGLARASVTLGAEIGVPDLMKAIEAVRTKVLDLHGALQQFERFDLPEPGEHERELVAGFWEMDVLREKDVVADARATMWQSKREELEAWEREQAEKLRAER